MLDCSACTLRAIRAIAGESLITNSSPRLLLTPHLIRQTSRRAASTHAASKAAGSSSGNERYLNAAQIRHHRTKDNDQVGDVVKAAISASDGRAIQKELRWLQDPLKFAEHVHYTIRCDKPDKALELCRAASREMDCVVAWNHIVDYYMKNQKIGEAIKIYNEMKKRAQFPDSYTYILLLRGFVGRQNHHRKVEVKEELAAKAVNIYNSMNSPTSRVSPTIMHTNAVLRVCSYAHDMDAFWGVASTIPPKGPRSADVITYTTILQAIKHSSVSKLPDTYSPAERSQAATQSIHEAKKVWQEVIQKWRSGEVKIDEELVCSMARVLLLSDRMQDWDDVFSLIKQTMQIERLLAPLGSKDRQTEHVPQLKALPELSPSEQEDHEGYVVTPAGVVFKEVQPMPADPNKPNRPTSLTHAEPGNDALSVLIHTCVSLRAPATANAYWDLLTKAYGVRPDLANFHALLTLLRHNRSSTRAATIVSEDMRSAEVKPKVMTFRLAMGVCTRDKNNHNVLENARTIVDVMEKNIADLDVHTLKQYFSLALISDDGPKIVSTLNRLDSMVHNLRSLVTYGSSDEAMQEIGAVSHQRTKEDILGFFAQMIGAIDTLMNRGLVPREDFTHWHGRRSQLLEFTRRARQRIGDARQRLEDGWAGDRAGADGANLRELSSGRDTSVRGKPDRMTKGSWELMMFRRRNAVRRTSPRTDGDAWGVQGRTSSGHTRVRKDSKFADSPSAIGV